MKEIINEIHIGDMLIQFLKDENDNVGLQFIPFELKDDIVEKEMQCNIENIVQIYFRGDKFNTGFANGLTLNGTQTSKEFKFDSQEITEENHIITVKTKLSTNKNHVIHHFLEYNKGSKAFTVKSIFENNSEKEVIIENFTSFSLSGLTPFDEKDAPNSMIMHRIRSFWSAEGRLESIPIEEMQLEPSWSNSGIRIEKFGQVGSMPVKKFFPFVAIEDSKRQVIWAVQLACPASWQIELKRRDAGLSVFGGLADFEFGHWAKKIKSGESFQTPTAYLTVGKGDIDEISQRLISLHKIESKPQFEKLPIIFNEYCTTWGTPSYDNIHKIMQCIKGMEFDYFVIDCGWYSNKKDGWYETNGDWEVSEELFPNGLEKTIEMIKENGFKPGIWFEFETCAKKSKMSSNIDYLLKRNGYLIDTEIRHFLDMRKEETKKYLDEKVIDMLKKYDFEYLKIDYNETIGIGCDGAESLGEGLRQNIESSQNFIKKISNEIPNICIENCSSGGHRLEPSMMSICDLASFSDAHECEEIPIIAANLHRVIDPAKSQIWAVIHEDDSFKRIYYSIINTFLGVMCISGDVYNLTSVQKNIINNGILFYKKISHIIKDGISKIIGDKIKSYRHPYGWQAVIRTNLDSSESLIIVHRFDGEGDENIKIPVNQNSIEHIFSYDEKEVFLENGFINIVIKEKFDCIAIYLK